MFIYNTRKLPNYQLHQLLKDKYTLIGPYSSLETLTIQTFLEEHLTFTDKNSYLEWVMSWKEQYKELTLKCRLYKKLPAWDAYGDNKSWDEWFKKSPVGSRNDLYLQARFMLMVRALGKIKSWKMKQENKLQ